MTQTIPNPARFREQAENAARLLKAMANEHRLMILCRLGENELPAGALLEETTLSQSALSQHLAVLREESLVSTRRESQTIFYRISDPAAVKVIAVLAGIFCPED